MEKVGVVVLNYNGMKYVDPLYRSLLAQTYQDMAIYVVDNASSDGSVEAIRRDFPDVHVIQLNDNYGFTKAFNYAAARLEHEFLALINNDLRLEPTWLEEAMKAIERDERIAIANSKVLFWENPTIINSAGAQLTYVAMGHLIGIYQPDAPKFNRERYIGMAQGVSLLVRREAFLRLGGFDERFFMLVEELDLSWRCWLAGYRIIYAPKSVLYHAGAYSLKKKTRYFVEFLIIRNRYLTILKNVQKRHLLFYLGLTLFYDALKILTSRNLAQLKAFGHAAFEVIARVGESLRRRRIVQDSRVFSDRQLLEFGLFTSLAEIVQTFSPKQLLQAHEQNKAEK